MHVITYLKNNFRKMLAKRGYKSCPASGFTIIESLVAVMILVMSVTGPLALAARGLSFSTYAREEITAFYLASEGMETIRNIRDSNLLSPESGKDWLGRDMGGNGGLGRCKNNPCYLDVWKSPPELRKSFDDVNNETISLYPTDYSLWEYKLGDDENSVTRYGYNFDTSGRTETPDQTIYSRKLIVEPIGILGSENEARVTVIVSWYAKNNIYREVILSNNIFKL